MDAQTQARITRILTLIANNGGSLVVQKEDAGDLNAATTTGLADLRFDRANRRYIASITFQGREWLKPAA